MNRIQVLNFPSGIASLYKKSHKHKTTQGNMIRNLLTRTTTETKL